MYDSDQDIKETVGDPPPQSLRPVSKITAPRRPRSCDLILESALIAHSGLSGVRAYVHGIKRGLSRWKTVAGLYLVELSWVFLFSLPVYFVFRNLTAKRPAGEGLITSFDIELLSEIFMDHPVLASSLIGLILAAGLSYFIVSAFFIGGLIGTEVFIHTAANKDKETARKRNDKTRERAGDNNSEKAGNNNDENNQGRNAERDGESEDENNRGSNCGSDKENDSGSNNENDSGRNKEGDSGSDNGSDSGSDNGSDSGSDNGNDNENNGENNNGKIEQNSETKFASKTPHGAATTIAPKVAKETDSERGSETTLKTGSETDPKTVPVKPGNRDADNKGKFAAESIKRGPLLLLIHILYLIPGLLFLFILMVSLELGSSLGEDLSHSGKMLVSILSAVPALALLTLWDTSLDFSRVWFVRCHPRGWRGLLRAFGAGWGVLWRRGAAAVLLHIGYLALSLIVSLVMLMVFALLNMAEAFPPLVTFLIVQIFSFLRTFVRSSSLLAHHAFIAGRK